MPKLTNYPKQGNWLNLRTKVMFNYDDSTTTMGTIVREDAEAPHKTIIKLDDGRYVLSTECQYQPCLN